MSGLESSGNRGDMTVDEPGERFAVRCAGLNFVYGRDELCKQVLFDINLKIPAGQVVIFSGPAGSGKTTLLRLLGAMIPVRDGSVVLARQEIRGLPPRALTKVRRQLGFVSRIHNLVHSLTALQNVELASFDLSPAETRRRAEELLQALGLEHRFHFFPRSLAGGQRQRVAVARALINRPRLILADEPTAPLDSESTRHVVNLLRTAAKDQGTAILMATPDHRIADVADRFINMVDGRIVSDTTLRDADC